MQTNMYMKNNSNVCREIKDGFLLKYKSVTLIHVTHHHNIQGCAQLGFQ